MTDAGWLQISTAGFAALNQSRPPEHLVKELVQNSLDAVQDAGGTVELDYRHDDGTFFVECRDTGAGISDLGVMRVVYLTFKTDSHLKRGRFGRGFKEILSVAKSAIVASGTSEIHFLVEDGQQVTREVARRGAEVGTRVYMTFDWSAETKDDFDEYFSSLIVPSNVTLKLNGNVLPARDIEHEVGATLTTEVYNPESQSWKKPRRKTAIELVETRDGEEPQIYEMGIPVASAEWSVPYHANIRQRVPMNPNRDALAPGYAKRIHTACLPTLLPELSEEDTTADWVGSAGIDSAPEVQKEIIAKAFGDTAVRSVPTMGKRDFDHDAERIGAAIVKTAQMSSGFREMAKEHLPTAKEAVVEAETKIAREVTQNSFNAEEVTQQEDPRLKLIDERGGQAHINGCLDFAVWFCQKLVDSTGDMQLPVTGNLAIGAQPELFGTELSTFLAHWSDGNRLTLALDVDCFWEDPLGAEALSILIHEAAHARAMHHGKGFTAEVERLGGVAAEAVFQNRAEIMRRWPQLAGENNLTAEAHLADETVQGAEIADPVRIRSWLRQRVGL